MFETRLHAVKLIECTITEWTRIDSNDNVITIITIKTSSECFRVNLARLRVKRESSRSSANHHRRRHRRCFLCKLDVGLFIRLRPEIEQHDAHYNLYIMRVWAGKPPREPRSRKKIRFILFRISREKESSSLTILSG